MAAVKLNQNITAQLIKLLLEGPVTAHDVSEETGLHLVTAQGLMRTLRRHKVAHIASWDPDRLGRDVTPVYKLGPGKDKARRKLSPAERTRRYRERKALRVYDEALRAMVEPVGACA